MQTPKEHRTVAPGAWQRSCIQQSQTVKNVSLEGNKKIRNRASGFQMSFVNFIHETICLFSANSINWSPTTDVHSDKKSDMKRNLNEIHATSGDVVHGPDHLDFTIIYHVIQYRAILLEFVHSQMDILHSHCIDKLRI